MQSLEIDNQLQELDVLHAHIYQLYDDDMWSTSRTSFSGIPIIKSRCWPSLNSIDQQKYSKKNMNVWCLENVLVKVFWVFSAYVCLP